MKVNGLVQKTLNKRLQYETHFSV